MPLAAGRLNKRLTLYRSIRTQNSDGQIVESPNEVCTVWAELRPISSSESFQQGQVQGSRIFQVTIRYRDDVNHKWWGEYNGRRLNFDPPTDPGELHEELIIIATELV